MDYLSSIWTQQDYPDTKKWFWWKCAEYPGVSLYTDKLKQRGVIQESLKLWKVVIVSEAETVRVVGIYPRAEHSGNKLLPWLNRDRRGAIPQEELSWLEGAEKAEY